MIPFCLTTYGINCVSFFLNIQCQFTLLMSFLAVMGEFKVLDGRGDNKNILSNLSFICRDSCNDYKLPKQSVSVDL